MNGIYTLFASNCELPVYDIVRKTSRFRFGQILEKTQWFSPQEVALLQNKNLRALLTHAYHTVPYYRKVFRERGLRPNEFKSPTDLAKLPELTKEDIRKNFNDLISRSIPKDKLVSSQSGGTGSPIKFYSTREKLSWEVAAEYRAYDWAGYRFGDRCFMFWGSPIDLAKSSAIVRRFTRIMERVTIADTFFISDAVLGKFAHQLRKFRPRIVRGYSSSVFMMAKYLAENGIDDIRPKAVITSAETLFDYMRKTIEAAFGCPVFDYYGSREIGAIAAECEEHSGYHITAENVVVEFVNKSEPVVPGEKGMMLVTNLRNFAMPFIRYNIGDVGKPAGELCSCGRGLPLASSIEGRVSDFVAVYDKQRGHVVPIGPFYPVIISAIMHLPLKDCQVIQETLNRLVIRIVKDDGFSQKHTDFLVDYMHRFLGSDVDIEIEFVDFIPPLPSGKRSNFISRINPFVGNA